MACHPDDVLVIGAGRRGTLARALSCRVSRYCLAHAQCPVIAVPPTELAQVSHGLRGWAFRHRGLRPDDVVLPATHWVLTTAKRAWPQPHPPARAFAARTIPVAASHVQGAPHPRGWRLTHVGESLL